MIRSQSFPRLWKILSSETMRDGLLVFVATVLVNASNYAFHFIASHRMTVDDYGAFSAMIALMTVVSVPATIVMTVIAKSIAEFCARGQREQILALQHAILRPVLALAGAILTVSILARGLIASYLQLANSMAIPLAGLATALALILPVMRGTLQGTRSFSALANSLILESGGKLFAGTALMLMGFGLIGGLSGITIGTALALCVALLKTQIFMKTKTIVHVDWQRLGSTSLGVSATTLCLGSLGSFDVVLVRHFFTPHEAGIYSAVALIGKIFLFAISFIPVLLLPKATEHAVQQSSALKSLTIALCLGGGLSIIGLWLIACWPDKAIRLLPGSAYEQAAPFLLRYSVATVLLALTTITTTLKIGMHHYLFLAPLALCTLGELVAINLWHPSLLQVINILLVGHALAFLGCFVDRSSQLRTLEQ